MSSLQDICDLPIQYDDFEDEIKIAEEELSCSKRTVTLSSISPTLLNKSILYPQEVYEEYSVPLEENLKDANLKYDILVLPAGLLGIEFIKSHMFYTPSVLDSEKMHFASIVEGIQGITTIIMQKNSFEKDSYGKPNVKEGYIMKLGPKEKVAIPAGYYYTFINTNEKCAVISRVYKKSDYVDYRELNMSGMAYFCIRKNAKQELVYNPTFGNTPSIKKTTPQQNHLPRMGVNLNFSLYNLVKEKTEMLLNILV